MATFTTIAAGIGLAAQGTAAGMSFAQARKQRKLQQKAEEDAAKMMADARKKLEVNYYDQLAIQKEPYEMEREALIAAGAQAIEAGMESERGAASVAGRVQMAQQAGQREIASAMGQEMLGLEKLSAQEESRLRDVGVQLDLAEVEGAQMAAAQAAEAANMATAQGMESVVGFGQQIASMAPLYEKSASARELMKIQRQGGNLNLGQTDIQKSIAQMGTINNIDLSKVANMNPNQFQDFMSQIDPGTMKMIRQNFPNYASSFNPNPITAPTTIRNQNTGLVYINPSPRYTPPINVNQNVLNGGLSGMSLINPYQINPFQF